MRWLLLVVIAGSVGGGSLCANLDGPDQLGKTNGRMRLLAQKMKEYAQKVSQKVKNLATRLHGQTPEMLQWESDVPIWDVVIDNRYDFLYDQKFTVERRTTPLPQGPPTLTYRNVTDFFVLKEGSKVFGDGFFLPLAVIANLSLERTRRSRLKNKIFGTKYAPRWQAYMWPLVRFVDELSKQMKEKGEFFSEEHFVALLDGSCDGLEGQYAKSSVDQMAELKKKYYGFHGADRGLSDEWTWDDAIKLGRLQIWCGFTKFWRSFSTEDRTAPPDVYCRRMWQLRQKKLRDDDQSNQDVLCEIRRISKQYGAAIEAKNDRPQDFLTLLSKHLPSGWKFGRGIGVFRKGLILLGF